MSPQKQIKRLVFIIVVIIAVLAFFWIKGAPQREAATYKERMQSLPFLPGSTMTVRCADNEEVLIQDLPYYDIGCKIGVLKNGDSVRVLSREGDWVEIPFRDTQRGYILARYVLYDYIR